jgi:hypothetical protein
MVPKAARAHCPATGSRIWGKSANPASGRRTPPSSTKRRVGRGADGAPGVVPRTRRLSGVKNCVDSLHSSSTNSRTSPAFLVTKTPNVNPRENRKKPAATLQSQGRMRLRSRQQRAKPRYVSAFVPGWTTSVDINHVDLEHSTCESSGLMESQENPRARFRSAVLEELDSERARRPRACKSSR